MRALIKNTPKHYDFSVQGNKGLLFPYVGKCFKISGQVRVPVNNTPPPAPPKPVITPALTGLVLIPPRSTYRVLITSVDTTVQETNTIYIDPPVIINDIPPRVECSLLEEPSPDNPFILEYPDKTGEDKVLIVDCLAQPTPPPEPIINKLGPVIITQPESTRLVEGVASLFVVVDGTPPFKYRWRKDDIDLIGQINSTVFVTSEGKYDVVVSNDVGTVVSEPALVINPAVGTPPTITRQPIGGALTSDSLLLNVIAAGTPPLKYNWYKNNQKITVQGGEYESTLEAFSPGSYYVEVSNDFGFIASDIVDVTSVITITMVPTVTSVDEVPVIIDVPTVTVASLAITKQPVGGTINAGETFTLFVAASGTPPIEYQWRRGRLNINGETNTSISVTQPGYYDVIVSNSVGEIVSDLVELVQYAVPAPYSTTECLIIAEESTPSSSVELQSNISEQTVEFLCGDAKPVEDWYIAIEESNETPLLIDEEPTNKITP